MEGMRRRARAPKGLPEGSPSDSSAGRPRRRNSGRPRERSAAGGHTGAALQAGALEMEKLAWI